MNEKKIRDIDLSKEYNEALRGSTHAIDNTTKAIKARVLDNTSSENYPTDVRSKRELLDMASILSRSADLIGHRNEGFDDQEIQKAKRGLRRKIQRRRGHSKFPGERGKLR